MSFMDAPLWNAGPRGRETTKMWVHNFRLSMRTGGMDVVAFSASAYSELSIKCTLQLNFKPFLFEFAGYV